MKERNHFQLKAALLVSVLVITPRADILASEIQTLASEVMLHYNHIYVSKLYYFSYNYCNKMSTILTIFKSLMTSIND